MQSENQNEQRDMQGAFELRPGASLSSSEAGETASMPSSGLVFMQLEEDGTMTPSPKPVGNGEYSFIEHLSSREIYQMPDADSIAGARRTYVPRFTGAGEHYRVTPNVPKKTPQIPVEDLSRASTPTPIPVPPSEPSVPIQIVAQSVSDNPPVPEHPTAEEDFTPFMHEATVVTVTPGNTPPPPEEDVFVLQKPLAARSMDAGDERTEEDERREIMDTMSPLAESDARAEITEEAVGTDPDSEPEIVPEEIPVREPTPQREEIY